MDLAYLPECLSYVYARRPNQAWEEQTWTEINQTKKKTVNNCTDVKVEKKTCQLCKEKQKRNLSVYIKDKLRRDSESSSCIREEDEEETEAEICNNNKTDSGCGVKKRTISE